VFNLWASFRNAATSHGICSPSFSASWRATQCQQPAGAMNLFVGGFSSTERTPSWTLGPLFTPPVYTNTWLSGGNADLASAKRNVSHPPYQITIRLMSRGTIRIRLHGSKPPITLPLWKASADLTPSLLACSDIGGRQMGGAASVLARPPAPSISQHDQYPTDHTIFVYYK